MHKERHTRMNAAMTLSDTHWMRQWPRRFSVDFLFSSPSQAKNWLPNPFVRYQPLHFRGSVRSTARLQEAVAVVWKMHLVA